MDSTKDTGVDFIHRLLAEVKVLQEDVSRLARTTAQVGSEVKAEQASRESDVSALHTRLSQERAAETMMRQTLEKKQDDFEAKSRTWVGALGKDLMGTKEAVAELEKSTAERFTKQSLENDARFLALEAAMPKKSEKVDLDKLADEVLTLQGQVERNRSEAAAAVRTTAAAASADFKAAQESIEQLRQATEAGRRALAADLGTLSSKLDTVDAFAQTRAKASDLQALEPRVSETEKSIEKLAYEVKTKAATATVNAISDRLTTISMDIQANQARAQADKENIMVNIDKLEKALSKTDRQADSDRERTSSCLVALEKEIALKAAKAETDLIGPKTLSTATDRLEARAQELEKTIALNKQEVPPIRARVEALETAFPTRADAAEIPKLNLAIAEQAAKHDSLHTRSNEHNVRLEKISGDISRHLAKIEAVESRSVLVERQLTSKAEVTDHFTKDHTSDLLRDFYRREEIDAMLSRVWWRVGDITKGRTVSGIPLSAR